MTDKITRRTALALVGVSALPFVPPAVAATDRPRILVPFQMFDKGKIWRTVMPECPKHDNRHYRWMKGEPADFVCPCGYRPEGGWKVVWNGAPHMPAEKWLASREHQRLTYQEKTYIQTVSRGDR